MAGTRTDRWNETKRRILDDAELAKALSSTEQEKAEAVTAETLGIEPWAMLPAEMEINELLLERIVGRNDLLGIAYMDRGLVASRTVGCVRLFDNGRCVGSGTGFMVSPRLLLTNNHVLENAAMGRQARVVFNFQDDPDGNALSPITSSLDPDTFFLTSHPLDFTLIAVSRQATEGTVDLEEIGWSRLIEAEGKVINGEYVTIVQHPNGQPKQIALRENQIIDVLDNFLHYHTDTRPVHRDHLCSTINGKWWGCITPEFPSGIHREGFSHATIPSGRQLWERGRSTGLPMRVYGSVEF
ncbi:MAG TPA: serine protease [Nitrospira sp.]|nr:serine protease [Nitrospira sp.]